MNHHDQAINANALSVSVVDFLIHSQTIKDPHDSDAVGAVTGDDSVWVAPNEAPSDETAGMRSAKGEFGSERSRFRAGPSG